LIPILAVLGVLFFPCLRSYAGVNTREFMLGIGSSVAIFSIVFGLPLLCVCLSGHPYSFYHEQLANFNVSYIEVYSPLFCYLVLLYLAAYISIVSLDIEHIIDISKRARYEAFCRSTRLISLIPLDDETATEVTLEQIIHSLRVFRGGFVSKSMKKGRQGAPNPPPATSWCGAKEFP
jgi:hypothetical protein